jgi:hypothetical protein
MAVAGIAVLTALALSNVSAPSVHAFVKVLIAIWSLSQRSYTFSRACVVLWPFLIVISAIRDIVMIVELQRG